MKQNNFSIGVIGVGHLGEYHVKHLKTIKKSKLIGIFDSNSKRASIISKRYGVDNFNSQSELIEKCDAISIVTPTESHYKIAKTILKYGKHVFVEKPITANVRDANELIDLAIKRRLILQVGHIERINPALLALSDYKLDPKYIEIQRLAPYSVRGTDVPVVLDKMIHDLDILLSLVKTPLKEIHADGLSILTESIDMAHARISFQNNTTANITSSRIAKEDIRKVKLFQKNLYCTLDLLKGSAEIYEIDSNIKSNIRVPFEYKGKQKTITYTKPIIRDFDPLRQELKNFINSIAGKEKPIVDGINARNALALAIKINKLILRKSD